MIQLLKTKNNSKPNEHCVCIWGGGVYVAA